LELNYDEKKKFLATLPKRPFPFVVKFAKKSAPNNLGAKFLSLGKQMLPMKKKKK
jgi:hypothetical protein